MLYTDIFTEDYPVQTPPQSMLHFMLHPTHATSCRSERRGKDLWLDEELPGFICLLTAASLYLPPSVPEDILVTYCCKPGFSHKDEWKLRLRTRQRQLPLFEVKYDSFLGMAHRAWVEYCTDYSNEEQLSETQFINFSTLPEWPKC